MSIEFWELLGRNPIFQVLRAAYLLHLKAFEILGLHLELKYVTGKAGAFVSCIPVTRDLLSVLAAQHRIENWLLRKPGRKLLPSARCNQLKLLLADWTVESNGIQTRDVVSRLPATSFGSDPRSSQAPDIHVGTPSRGRITRITRIYPAMIRIGYNHSGIRNLVFIVLCAVAE